MRPYLPLLGLVDSELWAFGRLLSLKLRDGTKVHDRYLNQKSQGPIRAEDIMVSQEEWEEMFQQQGPNQQLRRYWEFRSKWPASKSVNLDAALREISWEEGLT